MSRFIPKISRSYIISSTLLSLLVIVLITGMLVIQSFEALTELHWQLFTVEWNPPTHEYGILPMLYGSIVVTLIAVIVAVPLGIFAAFYTAEFIPARYRLYVKSLLELLAGIPSIIYGLIGLAFFSVWIREGLNLTTGHTLFTGGILLAIMILPTIITLSDDAIRNIPKKYKENALSLGLYPFEVVKNTLFPMARPQIFGSVLLGLSRALGETMAVMLVVGSIGNLPQPLYNIFVPGQTVTAKLGREMTQTAFGSLHFDALVFMGLVLLILVLLFTLAALQFVNPEQRLYE